MKKDQDESFDLLGRASEEMAPTNPSRGRETIRIITNTPSELEVRLVTFYTQFSRQMRSDGRVDTHLKKYSEDCMRTERNIATSLLNTLFISMIPDEVTYFHRIFYYPVASGLQVQNVVLDEVLPGKCEIGISSIGYEIKYKAAGNQNTLRYVDRVEVLVSKESGALSAQGVVNCKQAKSSNQKEAGSFLQCTREMKTSNDFYLGPVATSGAEVKLDFRYRSLPADN